MPEYEKNRIELTKAEADLLKNVLESPARREILLVLYEQEDMSFASLQKETSLPKRILLEELERLVSCGAIDMYGSDMYGPVEEVVRYRIKEVTKRIIPYLPKIKTYDLEKIVIRRIAEEVQRILG
jgi:DNA-binding transcriptional ArsR family regulator